MNQRIVYAVLAALTFAAPATAEPRRLQGSAAGVLPPYEIVTIIRSTGLDPLGRPARRGANYVLHAIDEVDREVRVVVQARSGRIVSVTPVATASPMPPRGVIAGPYEPMPSADYLPPEPPDLYEAGPPVIYGPPPVIYGPPPVPEALPPARTAVPPPIIAATPSDPSDTGTVAEPKVIRAIEPGEHGLLPPPPERFPRRAPPQAAKPKPAKRTVASLPKQPPLPKPRPSQSGTGTTSKAPAVQGSKPAAAPVPD